MQGASKLRERIEPNEQATQIPEPVQKGVHVAKTASGMHVHVHVHVAHINVYRYCSTYVHVHVCRLCSGCK